MSWKLSSDSRVDTAGGREKVSRMTHWSQSISSDLSSDGWGAHKKVFHWPSKECALSAHKTVRDLLLNAVELYRFLIATHNNSYSSVLLPLCASASPLLFRNKFHRSLIFHYFIRLTMFFHGTGAATRNGTRFCFPYYRQHPASPHSSEDEKRRLCCAPVSIKWNLNTAQ